MTPRRWKWLFALVPLAFVAMRVRVAPVAAGEFDEEPPSAAFAVEAEPTTLREVRADPGAFLGRRVRFTLQFNQRQETWNPGLTRFGTTDWAAFEGWADEDFTWDERVYDHPMRRLFVRRGGGVDELLSRTRRYERFEVTGTVREVFFDDPWIEIEAMRPLFELVSEGTILHVGRAYRFARDGKWDLAVDQFERAKTAPIPAAARAQIERKIDECRRHKRERRKGTRRRF